MKGNGRKKHRLRTVEYRSKNSSGDQVVFVIIQTSIGAKVGEWTEWMVEAGSPNRIERWITRIDVLLKHRDGRAELYLLTASPGTKRPYAHLPLNFHLVVYNANQSPFPQTIL